MVTANSCQSPVRFCRKTRAEPGCHLFMVQLDKKTPTSFHGGIHSHTNDASGLPKVRGAAAGHFRLDGVPEATLSSACASGVNNGNGKCESSNVVTEQEGFEISNGSAPHAKPELAQNTAVCYFYSVFMVAPWCHNNSKPLFIKNVKNMSHTSLLNAITILLYFYFISFE